ncbi:hypothetical protein ACF1AO_31435 [Streptomyces longwoodensis]|uniref:hypothetical protein n=1 Tax=Streptomyces longwoodensis TaxID=68231 RepID=UPI0033D93F3D
MSTGLPPIGSEIPRSLLARGATLEIDGATVRVDLRGGIEQRVDIDPDAPHDSVTLHPVGFQVTGELPDGRTVTLTQADAGSGSAGALRISQHLPLKYELLDVVPVTLTLSGPDGADVVASAVRPLVLVTKDVTQFPTRGDLSSLEAPVAFAAADASTTVVARLVTFPVQSGGV